MRFVIPFALIALFEVAALAKAASPAARIQALDPRLERVSWLPSDTRDLSYFPADQSPLLQWVKGSQMPLPPCFNTLSAKLDSHYMVASLSSSNAANIVHGQLDRNELANYVCQKKQAKAAAAAAGGAAPAAPAPAN